MRVRAGGEWTSARAPRGLWPIVGGNLSRDIPLRAHPIIVDGALPITQTGRAALYGRLAADRPLVAFGLLTIGTGVFLDGARLLLRDDGSDAGALYLDGGAGLRLAVAGSDWPALHVDIARGLAADRRWAVTVGLADVRWGRPGRAR